jgi:hypothetical protein
MGLSALLRDHSRHWNHYAYRRAEETMTLSPIELVALILGTFACGAWWAIAAVGCFAARRPLLGVFCLIVAALAAV